MEITINYKGINLTCYGELETKEDRRVGIMQDIYEVYAVEIEDYDITELLSTDAMESITEKFNEKAN